MKSLFHLIPLLLIGCCFVSRVQMVKRHEFKTCNQSGFCKRQRSFADLVDAGVTSNFTYSIVPGSLKFEPSVGHLSASLLGIDPTDVYTLSVTFLEPNVVRLKIKERSPLYPRYEEPLEQFCLVGDELKKTLSYNQKTFKDQSSSSGPGNDITEIAFGDKDQYQLTVHSHPFKFELAVDNVPAISFNERGYFYYEDYRKREEHEQYLPPFAKVQPLAEGVTLSETESNLRRLKESLVEGSWEETFNEKPDSKPKGPSSIGLDISFPGSSHVYGLPQHASNYALKSTRGKNAEYSDPYRLYNLDVFEYELDNPMALYGSVPFMLSHKKGLTTGVLWLNSAEMWVDVEKTKGSGSGFKLSNYVPFGTKKTTEATSVETHWMTESGVVDVFFFLGPDQPSVVNSYTRITGRPTLPQLFSVAYHQCRWNYNDEKDVREVDANFDMYDIPYDVLWLDIEHTNEKRYFTWDAVKFANPMEMQKNLSAKGRKMVTIIDPHIKRDSNWEVFKGATDQQLFVKNVAGDADFNGWCWPGDSSWLDYTNPDARSYWAQKFAFDKYTGSTPSLYTWNDMNEPSVFTGPEITMPKDVKHYQGWEHRDVHNIYGLLLHRATYEGHLLRSNNQDRPFILSRAFFVGTQRYGAIWTGDNMAQWEHLAASVPMLLSIGMSGIVFSGADVGGFFGNPDPELLVRWYQVGSLQPFFRAHAHLDSIRREPWLFGEPYTTLIKEAVRRRYRLLPYIYTLFQEATLTGAPIMRPMMYEFPEDDYTYDMDSQFMLGSSILVKPVSRPGQVSTKLYLPKSSLWYKYETFEKLTASSSTGEVTVKTPLHVTPIYLRGGSILVRRDRTRRSSTLMKNDPYTLVIALGKNKEASGRLYVDDGASFEYTSGKYVEQTFELKDGTLVSEVKHTYPEYSPVRFERIILVGAGLTKWSGGKVQIKVDGKEWTPLTLAESVNNGDVLVFKNPPIRVGERFVVQFK